MLNKLFFFYFGLLGKAKEYWEAENINEEMPTCQQMFNIFHPFDPVAYRSVFTTSITILLNHFWFLASYEVVFVFLTE